MSSEFSAGPYLRRAYVDSSSSRDGNGNGTSEKRVAHRPRLSTASLDSRFSAGRAGESETDCSEIHSPQPRRLVSPLLQPWLNAPPSPAPFPVLRASSPLRQPSFHASDAVSFSAMTDPERRASTLDAARLESPARRWVRWMAKAHLRTWTNVVIVLGAVWVRWAVGLGGYSGAGTPPMYGDYEAQRHWMEITLHLSSRQWYSYDLLYWGLDYPPLTAYVSYLCGLAGHFINPKWVELGESRGYESPESKTFMRATVLVFDLAIYFSAAYAFTYVWWGSRSRRTQSIALLTVLFQPALILIDYGHFQYNSVMLGLTLWSIVLFHTGHDLLGAVAFVLSLGFKQMALYYSPAIFAYLLGSCIVRGPAGRIFFVKLGLTTIASFIVVFLPFLRSPFPGLLLQSIARIFPFNRGLFEDKVANFWCASNVVLKWKRLLPPSALMRASTLATLSGIVPPMFHVLRASWQCRDTNVLKKTPGATSPPNVATRVVPPTVTLLPLALFNSSLAFFMFSFQVHEKSILIPLLPLTLLMGGRSEVGSEVGIWEWGVLVNNVAMFSMWPLLQKDGQGLQYLVVTFLWNYLIGYNPLRIPSSFVKTFGLAVYAAIAVLHVAEHFFVLPTRYPDLFAVLNVLVSATVFGLAWLWGMNKQLEAGWAISPLRARAKTNGANGKSSPPAPATDVKKGNGNGAAHSRRNSGMKREPSPLAVKGSSL